jgi:hypothetical protein
MHFLTSSSSVSAAALFLLAAVLPTGTDAQTLAPTNATTTTTTTTAVPTITYYPSVTASAWMYSTTSVGQGNGVFIEGTMAVIVSRDCTVAALDVATGTQMWKAASTDPSAVCYGGAYFGPDYVAVSHVSAEFR